ncbi:DUF3006 domain-containing protein [Deinococcus aestuarii]|uniref:DUF3006 domain-containing protein n=1 Tax=Deinococcus aestuarii TaxID=2774531 RepID=UPI001C0E857F|nr:DUF3006 domain-containing protein [Deinococcus aestuarii]
MSQENSEAADVLSAVWVVDGLEGHLARVELEDGEIVDMALASLPRGVKEGDVLRVVVEGGDFSLELDPAETARRRTSAQAALNALNMAAPGGEIDL